MGCSVIYVQVWCGCGGVEIYDVEWVSTVFACLFFRGGCCLGFVHHGHGHAAAQEGCIQWASHDV